MPALRRIVAAAVACSLVACKAVGPNFTAPQEPTPEHYAGAPQGQAEVAAAADSTAAAGMAGDTPPGSFWWREFHDPVLEQLEDRVAAGNLDLKAAYLRIVEARIQVQSARAQGLPSLSASASFTREQLGIAGILKEEGIPTGAAASATEQELIGSLEAPVNIYQLGFDASWELDLFGRVRRAVEAAKAQTAAAVESRNDMLVSLQAEVAQNYLQLRAGQALMQLTRSLVADQQEALQLTADRQRHGLAGEGDVDSASAQLSNLRSQLPPYEQTVATSRHALAVLSGQAPEALDAEFGKWGDLPAPPAAIEVGVPSTLARRRPDIRNAEASLHAATAQIGVSVAALFPDISLTGTFGLRNVGTAYLFDWASHFYTFGPSISLPLFQGGALVANVRLSRTEAAAAALNYRKTVLNALQEVEDGLSSLQEDAQRGAALQDAVDADQRALKVDLDSYRHGLVSYVTVLTAQVQIAQAEQQLAQAQLTQGTDLVKLYKALGGGWQGRDAVGTAGGTARGSNQSLALVPMH